VSETQTKTADLFDCDRLIVANNYSVFRLYITMKLGLYITNFFFFRTQILCNSILNNFYYVKKLWNELISRRIENEPIYSSNIEYEWERVAAADFSFPYMERKFRVINYYIIKIVYYHLHQIYKSFAEW